MMKEEDKAGSGAVARENFEARSMILPKEEETKARSVVTEK